MKRLSVHLEYLPPDRQVGQRSDSSVSLPIKVVDAEGILLAETVAASNRRTDLALPDHYNRVFVRLVWPSGRTETQAVNLSEQHTTDVTFSESPVVQNGWVSWAIPRLNPRSQLVGGDRPNKTNIGQHDKVWLRLWRFESSDWNSTAIVASNSRRSDAARQIDLLLGRSPHMLQIGGSSVPWRLVSLPPAGRCRVLITPNESEGPRSDALKVVITGFRSDAETLLEFLVRDSIRDATTMAESTSIATELISEKFRDPLAAVAGGYYLLRLERWEEIPLSWWENLTNHFAWIPDTSILHCVRLLRAGLQSPDAERRALSLFKLSLDRGWPVYEEGLHLLLEAGSLLRKIAAAKDDVRYFARVDTLAMAKSWAGSALSFYGPEPEKPSAIQWVGTPRARRRHRLAGRQWQDRLTGFQNKALGEHQDLTISGKIRQLSSSEFSEEFARKPRGRGAGPDSMSLPSPIDRGLRSVEQRAVADRMAEAEKAKSRRDWILLGDIGG